MTKQVSYQVVNPEIWDSLPSHGRAREDSPVIVDLKKGETVFVEGEVTSYYERARRQGYQMSARKYNLEEKTGSLVRWLPKEDKKNGK